MKTKKKTINQMIKMIERRVCIRDIWRCRAGWGMRLIPHNCNKSRVYRYWRSLQQCVEMEFKYWVEGKDISMYPIVRLYSDK